jgi:molybdopterin synthase catalytic subunit
MFLITRDPIDPRAAEAAVASSAFGGVVTFHGVVREFANDGRRVSGLSYEAHEALAIAEFEAIACEARASHGRVEIAIIHRTGELAVGEIAVVVCAASTHRAAAFEVCEFTIDALKRRAAIWKKEHYVDGSAEWVANEC